MPRRRRSGPLLFDPGELNVRPSVAARLRILAGRPTRPPTRKEARLDEDQEMMNRLRGWGTDLARRFGLRYKALEAERDGVVEHYGICYEDGLIRIRLRHATTGRLLKQSSLVDTLCHELAHLRHMDHSIRFRRLYQRILTTARRLGYYQPGSPAAETPKQLPLFAPGACGTSLGRADER